MAYRVQILAQTVGTAFLIGAGALVGSFLVRMYTHYVDFATSL